MPSSTTLSEDTNFTEDTVILKIVYTCEASEQPQLCSYGSSPALTEPYYYIWETSDYSEIKLFYENYKSLPFCNITAAKSMKRTKPGHTIYWTDYEKLYHKRDGWLDIPVLSPNFV